VDGGKCFTFKLGQNRDASLGPKKQRDLLLDLTINLDGCSVVSNKTMKDISITLDPDLSFDEHNQDYFKDIFFPF
jgi:hypothetical protein